MPPEDPAIPVCSAPLLATAILLLATARTWRARRPWVEGVGTATMIVLASLMMARLPPAAFRATLPLASVLASWSACAHAAWRFAPDLGQRGLAWAFYAAAPGALPAALGCSAGLFLSPATPPLACASATAVAALASMGIARVAAPLTPAFARL